jgi:phosphatidylinositol alpha-1,6-mannosyltransferase
VLRRIARAADYLTYVSQPVLAALERVIPEGTTEFVRVSPAVNAGAFDPRPAEPTAARARLAAEMGLNLGAGPVVVCVSRLVKLKGQDTLLQAWPRVLREHPDATVVLVGGGPRREALEKLAARLGITESVRFVGALPHPQIPPVLTAADVGVLLTRPVAGGLVAEGMPTVVIEASAAALPVVVGRTGGAVESVQEGVTGFLVDPLDVQDVAARINQLLADPARAAAMGAAGRAWVASAWNWETRAATIRELLTH